MSYPIFSPTLFIIIMIILIVISSFSKTDFSDSFRKKQAKEIADDSGFMKSFKEFSERKVKFSKRAKIEKLERQAGFYKLRYYHYLLAQISCAIGLFFLVSFTNNQMLAAVIAFVGWMLPGQILQSIRNRRIEKLEQQIGPFLQMVIKRYVSTKDFEKAIKLTREEFRGLEPMYTELKVTTAEIDSKVPIHEALDNMAERSENKFLIRFADYYKIASAIGTKDARENLLGQAYIQFEEERVLRALLKKEISEPKRDALMMIVTIPIFMLFGIFVMDGYWEYITQEFLGKLLVAAVAFAMILLVWFLNAKIGGPLK